MKWRELIDEVAERTNQPRAVVLAVLRSMAKTSQEALASGEDVVVRGVGTILTSWRGPRTMRSVTTGEQVYLDGRYIAQFKPARPLKALLLERSPQTWQDDDHQAAWRAAENLISTIINGNGKHGPKLDCPPDQTDEILAKCRETFGAKWEQIEAQWSADVPEDIQAKRNYLAVAAHRRWS